MVARMLRSKEAPRKFCDSNGRKTYVFSYGNVGSVSGKNWCGDEAQRVKLEQVCRLHLRLASAQPRAKTNKEQGVPRKTLLKPIKTLLKPIKTLLKPKLCWQNLPKTSPESPMRA